MSTRRNFMMMAGAAALVSGATYGLTRGNDEPEEREVYSRLEEALLEENPDIAPETLQAIAAEFSQISDKLLLGTAGASGLTGAFFDRVSIRNEEDLSSGHNFVSAILTYIAVAGEAFDRFSEVGSWNVLSAHLQDKYSLSEVQSIHVAKTLHDTMRRDFQFRYGAFASMAGSAAHRMINYTDGRLNSLEPGQD